MKTIYRASIFTFNKNTTLQSILSYKVDSLFVNANVFLFLRDGAIVVENGIITEVDDFYKVQLHTSESDKLVDYSGKIIMPGFIDTHMHTTQTKAVGAYGEKLLEWLDNYIFPSEASFNSNSLAYKESDMLFKELFKHGTTTVCGYAPCAYDGTDIAFELAYSYNMRVILGNTIMTNGNKDLITDPKTSMKISEKLCEKWHNKRRLSYALTPRFALSCTGETLNLCKEFLQTYKDIYIQTHLSENLNEIKDTLATYPDASDYLNVYEKYSLITDKTILGHCLHLSGSEWDRIQKQGAIIANCPTSNNYLGNGHFDYKTAIKKNIKLTLATDWAAGNTLSLLRVMDDAYKAALFNSYKLETLVLLFCSTLGSAKALGLDDKIGSLEKNKEADFIVLDPQKNSLLSYRLEYTYNIQDHLFSIISLGDDRLIDATYIYGRQVY
ncbi:guanine deaminase [Allofrancisella inopinata]|uniref:Guanine deaminase n=1 Tax=Allofrancisella inopinata TaxID=1085647 RepID=A0AAE6YI26_9GAMM|nr:guanine deaminase [Allofrancisella inopinata]QIV96355.1 guanine deaminase [Allofrancisella inopinata]TDT73334.1 guanine deaminase [Allofrancisella inopinata]